MSGYATPYLTGYATPYAPGSAPAATTPVVPTPAPGRGGYFTGFATGYATGYFPGSVGGVAPPVVVGSFVAAIGTALVADATLMALVGGVVGGGAPAKVFNAHVPVKRTPPYLVIPGFDEPGQRVSATAYIVENQFQVVTYAAGRAQAKAIADRAETVLRNAHAAGTLLWSSGRLMDLWFDRDVSVPAPFSAPGSGRLWADGRIFGFSYQRKG